MVGDVDVEESTWRVVGDMENVAAAYLLRLNDRRQASVLLGRCVRLAIPRPADSWAQSSCRPWTYGSAGIPGAHEPSSSTGD